MVHGDYDVDGQCATALLTRALRAAGADVVPFVPHRLRDGYDFGPAGLAAAQAAGASLVITCDCGITAVETVHLARAAGIGVVVTDHHLPATCCRRRVAVIDPQRPDDTSGLTTLCGTGIAFKLVQALVPALGLPANLPYYLLDLVALATVADVVPLQGENRILVKHGLRLLGDSAWPGLRGLVAGQRPRRQGGARGPLRVHPGPAAQRGGPDRRRDGRPPPPALGRSGRGVHARVPARRAQHRAAGAGPADPGRGAGAGRAVGRSRARRGLRARGRRLASRAWWGSSPPAWSSATVGPRS